jgi:hypothetical protein
MADLFFPSIEVTSDVSGSCGCGAFSRDHGWFQLEWPQSWQPANIAAMELVPIVLAAALWGPAWHCVCVRFQCDNMAVVEVLRSHTSHDPLLMHLLRCLVFYAAVYHFNFVAQHLPGTHNSSQSVYRSGWRPYTEFCRTVGKPPLPLSEQTLCTDVSVCYLGNHSNLP